MLYFIITLLYFAYIKNYIIIPFETKEDKIQLLSHNSLMTTLFPNKIETKINVGTPYQEIPLRIKLLRYPISISSKSINFYKLIKFDEEKSSTYKSIDLKPNYYGYQDFQLAKKSKENFYLNEKITLKNLTFFLATYELDNYMESGVLGLRIPDNDYRTLDVNFIKQLKERDLINSYYFFLRYKNEKEGELIIGILPHQFDQIHFNQNNFVEFKGTIINYSLGLFFKEAKYGNKVIDKEFESELAIEDNFIRGNKAFQNVLFDNYFKQYFDRKICFNSTFDYVSFKKLEFYYCNKEINISEFQNITFNIKNCDFEIQFENKDLFFENGEFYYFLIYFPTTYYSTSSFRLGKPFFKKYLITFNQDTKMIGYYKNIINNKNNIKNIYPWIITIFCIFCMLLMGYYLFYYRPYKLRKKRANELEDDYEYVSNKNDDNNKKYFSINE